LDSGAPGGDSTHTVRVLFYYRGIENLGVGYLMSMLKHHGHDIDLIFDPGLDDNLFLKAPHLAWLNRHEQLLERAIAFRPDLIAMGSLTNLYPFTCKMAEKLLWWEYGCFKDNLEIFTGRGCPFKCTFCNIHYQREIFKGKGDFLRKRSIPNVIAEFKQNLAKYDVSFVSVHDDNFTTDPHW